MRKHLLIFGLALSLPATGQPILFTADVAEGNYAVKVTLTGQPGGSIVTVRAESRRLMLEKLSIPAGESLTRTFLVNVRYPEIGPGNQVRLKPRELGSLDWDHRLSLEFLGVRPSVQSVEVTKVDRVPTVYLAGDSTVVDQDREPWAAWGQMLPRFFGPGVAIANHAESGEALKSFVAEKRLEKIASTIQAGDYLFVQFTHNDQKPGPAHVDAFTTYKEYLKLYIEEARKHGATPVLVTSMHRRTFDENGRITNSLADYPEAMRQTAREEDVALIDLNTMSKALYEAWGPEGSIKAFVHYPANTFPGQNKELKDNTHFNSYGAYELARCVVEGMKRSKLELTKFLAEDALAAFDPAHPDPIPGTEQ